ncbi:hypothetical protein PLIIFM63780_001697 [Purpureocillium lilacinum]|uniref:CorA family metal ion transporter n=1 Tax=Purpureocillium lilacinum TaxID=33203 RepID=A0A179H2L1_PURLI|nr:CorA family metal ion transporter [Purpureocillium lilacinum]PWI68714.1 hypothetical protein PCL_01803 [Purpureocillium lilacinum]GJN68125.1 hypothetical protein PLICBS_002168 [Purpureocillium lilacinum]GJN78204.1 hypothetical protein PLIIFM63780_001697 [Purpureocillium lilacinum]
MAADKDDETGEHARGHGGRAAVAAAEEATASAAAAAPAPVGDAPPSSPARVAAVLSAPPVPAGAAAAIATPPLQPGSRGVDFATASSTAALPPRPLSSSEPHRVHYDLSLDTRSSTLLPSRAGDTAASKRHRSDTDTTSSGLDALRPVASSSYDAHGPPSPSVLRRRSTRAATLTTLDDHDDFDPAPYGSRPGWQPGSEPGFDPQLPDGGHASMPALSAPCEITVVDFSRDRVLKRHFDNDGFVRFVSEPKEPWAKCRWINVNGLSWDVIQAVGTNKGLHKLAIEDIMNIRNRTKADWYPNHAFIIMTLQKLVHVVDNDDSSSSSSSGSQGGSIFTRWIPSWLRFWGPSDKKLRADLEKHLNSAKGGPVLSDGTTLEETAMLRSLHQYHASGNEARTDFMEKNSSLAPYNMAVAAEQVSIFLTNDNTVISFFEISASDVERPIVTRLSNPGTILRESCDASLLVQAIIDAVIDLALPLTAVYTDMLGDLELDVLTAPSIKQCRSLYICIAEINKMLRFLSPIDNLVNVLRDHRTPLTQEQAARVLEDPASGVIVTPMTHTYLGDVLDHCVIITEAMQQLKQSSENLINLIFNTITATQNESMKQLTTVTIIFLPLTFITGFFGQNFAEDQFPEIQNGIWYFWAVAVPTAVATILILMREMIYAWFVRIIQRKRILSSRRRTKSRRRNQRMART